jgi:retron-type reverse transcriptase
MWGHRSLERAWHSIEENARHSKSETVKKEIKIFEAESSKRIRSLSGRLSKNSFKFAPARGIPIPKASSNKASDFRPIVLADVECRIVQRSILNVLLDVEPLQKYILTPYSFGGIRKKTDDSLGAVPAAVQAVLGAIQNGANFVLCADISKFFTRIPKSSVTAVIRDAVQDPEFINLFERAIAVELSNLAELREKASAFPTADIGVAQGNSLSPLLGNILLYDFDRAMNDGDCCCFRYIDDIIILAPSKKAAVARLKKAKKLLARYGMEFGAAKTAGVPLSVTDRFEFLGIEFSNGLLRPSPKAQRKFISSLREVVSESAKAFIAQRNGVSVKKEKSLIATLRRMDGMIQGWGKHYRFCNDPKLLESIDEKISEIQREYIAIYAETIRLVAHKQRRNLLGVGLLSEIERKPFKWPKKVVAQDMSNAAIEKSSSIAA